MTIKTKAQLHIENDNFIYDNYNEEITATNVNQLIGDMIDSFAVTSGTASASTLSETLLAGNDTGNIPIISPDYSVVMQIYDGIHGFKLTSGTSLLQMNPSGVFITDYSKIPSMDFGRRQSYDVSDYISIDWDGRYLYDLSLDGNISIDWANRQLIDGSGRPSMDWYYRMLFDGNDFAVMDYHDMHTPILIGDIHNNLNSVLININNHDNLMSFVGNHATPTGDVTSDMFTIYYPKGEVIFGDYNRNNYQHFINLRDNNQQININGLYHNVLASFNFYGTGLNDLSTNNCNSNSSLSFTFEIDSSGNPGYIFDTPTGTLNIGDIVTQTSSGPSIGVQGIYRGVDADGFSIFSYVMGSTPFDIGATVQTPGALWMAVVNSFINDECDTFYYLDSLGNSSNFNLIPNGGHQVSYEFTIGYTFDQKTGHTTGDYWGIHYNPVYGRYGKFSSNTPPISFGDIDGIYNNTTFNIMPQLDSISVRGKNQLGDKCSSFSINTKDNIIEIGDIDNRKNHTSLIVDDSQTRIDTYGFKGFVYSHEFVGTLNDIVINKRSDTSFPLNTTVNYSITISTASYPNDTISWTDNKGYSGSQLLDGNPITLSFGLIISFNDTTGHTLGDTWHISANNKYDLSSHIDGAGRTYQTGDIANVGNSTWTKIDDKKGSYDINGLQGAVFSGIQPAAAGTTTLSEQLFGMSLYFPFPINFTGPLPTDYTVQIDSVNSLEFEISSPTGNPLSIGDSIIQTSGAGTGTTATVIAINGTFYIVSSITVVGTGFQNGDTFDDITTGLPIGTFTSVSNLFDTFSYFDNQGNSSSFNPITGSQQGLSYNVGITFNAATGAVLGDSWYFGYYNGSSRMLSLNGAGAGSKQGYMQFGDVDGGVSGTQIMIIPEFKAIGVFGNIFQSQQDSSLPAFTLEATSGYPTFGNHHILSGLDGNYGTEASMAFGNLIGISQNDYWRIGMNIFNAGDNSFGIATDILGAVIKIDNITGYLSIAFVPTYSDDATAIGAGMISNQLYKNTTGGITSLCIVP